MIKFKDVFLFVWFTVFLVFWGVELFTYDTADKSYGIYVGVMFFSHIGLVALYLYALLKNIKGEDV
jgi:hypothetical protein